MSNIDSEQQTAGSSSRTKGRVKWFNNKAGYGFLTVGTGDDSQDVFVHHSALKTSGEQYKYAVEGEYVEFIMSEADSDKHKWQASEVTGLEGGPLLCETRAARRERFSDQDGEVDDNRPSRQYSQRPRSQPRRARGGADGGVPRFIDSNDQNYEWTLVRRRKAGADGQRRGGRRQMEASVSVDSGSEVGEGVDF